MRLSVWWVQQIAAESSATQIVTIIVAVMAAATAALTAVYTRQASRETNKVGAAEAATAEKVGYVQTSLATLQAALDAEVAGSTRLRTRIEEQRLEIITLNTQVTECLVVCNGLRERVRELEAGNV